MLSVFFALAFFCLCAQAALKDTMTLTIPNWMNATLIVLFVPAAFAASIGWQAGGAHLLVGLIALVIAFGLFAFNIFGGGDAKMIPGVLLWIGPAGVLHFIFGMVVAGGLLGLIILMARKAIPAGIAPGFAQKVLSSENGIPYGVAIAMGAFIAAPKSPLLIQLINQVNGIG